MIINLSPYEKNRMIPDAFGLTEMGRDLLAQDYILKQVTASVIYPEEKIGKEFWDRIYTEAQKEFGTIDIPIDTFNKVWIVPEKAVVYENNGVAFVIESSLKVMLEQDYLALQKSLDESNSTSITDKTSRLGSRIVREVVIPILTKEVNEGSNFAQLRQIYHSLVLAAWFKRKIKESILDKVYVDQKKVVGVDVRDVADKERIYAQYLKAFQTGVYNYVKEEYVSATQETVPRKYFSGGAEFTDSSMAPALLMKEVVPAEIMESVLRTKKGPLDTLSVRINPMGVDSIPSGRKKSSFGEDAAGFEEGLKVGEKDPFSVSAGDDPVAKGMIVILKDTDDFDETSARLHALIQQAFDARVVFYGGLTRSLLFDQRLKGRKEFQIAVPISGEIFTIRFQPQDPLHEQDALEIKVADSWVPFHQYIGELRAKIDSPEFVQLVEKTRRDLSLRLGVALIAKDEPQALGIVSEILAHPTDDNLRGLIGAFMPEGLSEDVPRGHSPRASRALYSRVVYVISQIISGRYNYQLPNDIRAQYVRLLAWLNSFDMYGADLVLSNGSSFVGQYVFENQVSIRDEDHLRKKILEYFILRTPARKGQDDYENGGQYEFTLDELVQAVNVSKPEAESIVDKLIAEGRVTQVEAERYETDLLNVLSASNVYQSAIDHIVARTYTLEERESQQRVLGSLAYIMDLRILDLAFGAMFAHSSDDEKRRQVQFFSENMIKRNIFNLRNRNALKGVVEKYYLQIKSRLLSWLGQPSHRQAVSRSDDVLACALAQAMVVDDELADAFMKVLDTHDDEFIRDSRAHFVLVETGRLIDGESIMEQAVNSLLEVSQAEGILDAEFSVRVKTIPVLLENIKKEIELNEAYMKEAQAIVTTLFDKYLSSQRKDEIKKVLEVFLDELVKIAQSHLDLYNKMLGSMRKTMAWNRFQAFYGFLKELRRELMERSGRSRTALLLGPIEGLMEQQGEQSALLPAVQRPGLLERLTDFPAQYPKALDKGSQLNLLLQRYPMREMQIEVDVVPAFLGMAGHGRAEQLGERRFRLSIIGVDGEYQAYLLFHEFQHLFLNDRGLTFEWNTQDGRVATYLFELRNLVQDYLIEKESQRQFGSRYTHITQDLRDADLIGQLRGLGTKDPVMIFMLAITAKVTVSLYPELQDAVSARLIGEGIQMKEMNGIMEALQTIDHDTSPTDFMAIVLKIHALLTGDRTAAFRNGVVSVDESLVLQYYEQMQVLIDQIHGLAGTVQENATTDDSMLSQKKGGIDFNTDKMNLLVHNGGDATGSNIDPAMFQQLQNATGFMPVVMDIQPLTSISQFIARSKH
ncbi:MAG: hypothetical protein HQL20_10025 [Candidatus Omnitrophica bacterium]|nr:hypothetical protein [Candidatus Omnitrophota bacterium]